MLLLLLLLRSQYQMPLFLIHCGRQEFSLKKSAQLAESFIS